MNKTDLVNAISESADLTKVDAAKALEAMLNAVVSAVAAGEEVALVGFGTFKRSERKARTGRNPQTGKELKIAASKVPAFKAGKAFKDAVNK